jgi:hypothetical protein
MPIRSKHIKNIRPGDLIRHPRNPYFYQYQNKLFLVIGITLQRLIKSPILFCDGTNWYDTRQQYVLHYLCDGSIDSVFFMKDENKKIKVMCEN